MPSTPLTDAIVALTTYANTITGESDATLSAAVESLVDGYGSGGIDINALADGSISGAIEVTASSIREGFFKGLTHITSISCPNITRLSGGLANGCTGLVSVTCPQATTVNSTQQFLGCTSLTTVNLPLLTTMGGNMFQGCSSLATIDLPKVTSLNVTRGFYDCHALQTIVIRNSTAVSLGGDTLTNTPFAGYGGLTGTAYVPSDQIETYKTKSNWSTLYNNGTCSFAAIEGSQYE